MAMTASPKGKGQAKPPAAGGGRPGTTGPDGAADEPAREALARAAEAVVQPGEDAGELYQATLEAAEPVVTHLRVRALQDGFRRCGRAWPAAGVEVSVDEFDHAELMRLMADPELVVESVCRPLPEIE
ncbi:hypothetical protein C662_10246 [Thauera sp. 28]|nr:hypothetical protein C662_10246 [Thauera sp. 28]